MLHLFLSVHWPGEGISCSMGVLDLLFHDALYFTTYFRCFGRTANRRGVHDSLFRLLFLASMPDSVHRSPTRRPDQSHARLDIGLVKVPNEIIIEPNHVHMLTN